MGIGKFIVWTSAALGAVGLGAFAVASASGGSTGSTGGSTGGNGTSGPGGLAGYELAEWTTGGASPDEALPTIVVLHPPTGGEQSVRQALAGFTARARILVPLGRTGEGQVRSYVDPLLPNLEGRMQVESVALQSLLFAALQSRKVQHRLIVVGLGGSGTLAVLLGMYAGTTVRQAFAVGGTLTTTQVGPAPTGAVRIRMLASSGLLPAMLDGTLEAFKVAAARGFDAQAEVGDVQSLPVLVQKWLTPQLEAGLVLP